VSRGDKSFSDLRKKRIGRTLQKKKMLQQDSDVLFIAATHEGNAWGNA